MSVHTFLIMWNGDVGVVFYSLVMAEDGVLVEEVLEVGIVVLLLVVRLLFAPLVDALSSVLPSHIGTRNSTRGDCVPLGWRWVACASSNFYSLHL